MHGECRHDSSGGGQVIALPKAGHLSGQPVLVEAGLHHGRDPAYTKVHDRMDDATRETSDENHK